MSNLITDIGRGADETDEGFVRIQYKINKLKAKSKGPPPVCKNADIEDPRFTEWGFSVIVRGHDNKELGNKAYFPKIVRLPYEILPKESYFTVEDNFIFAWLKKRVSNQSWENEITEDKLEMEEFS